MYDILIKNARIADGTGNPMYYADLAVKDGKIAVTQASCPDHHCMARGFCNSGAQIVCLPNRLVIEFLGDQEIDAAIGGVPMLP